MQPAGAVNWKTSTSAKRYSGSSGHKQILNIAYACLQDLKSSDQWLLIFQ